MFWAPSFNTFMFRCGLMGPTIADFNALLTLFTHGDYFGLEYSTDLEFTYLKVEAKGKTKIGKMKHISAYKYKTWLMHFKG